MPAPNRRGLYLLIPLLLIAAVAAWLFDWSGPGEAPPANPPPPPAADRAARPPEPGPPAPAPAPAGQLLVDPVHQERADLLHAADRTPQQDLEILAEFLQIYGKVFAGNPVGENQDITAALTGFGGTQGKIFPPNHRTIANGQLVDRWGSAYWFHPNSGSQMEIRSAGPDKSLFTGDDIVLNPSPGGFGATPQPDTPAESTP